MHALLETLRRFRADERGAFAALFGVIAVVLVAVAGAAVDYTSVEQARNRAQVALDAATLALQPSIRTETVAQIKTKAENLMVERLSTSGTWKLCTENGNIPPCLTLDTPAVDTTQGSLTLTAHLNIPLYFVALVGVDHLQASLLSEATRKQLYLEVALVLDNSGSMDKKSRMTNLKAAAKLAVSTIFEAAADNNTDVAISVVPFNSFVNIGAGNANASWIDRTGKSPVTRRNFDDDDNPNTPFNGPIDRIGIYNSFANGVRWAGCVEARPHIQTVSGSSTRYYDTDDTPPTSTDGNSLFTPLLAPDEPSYTGYTNNYISDTGGTCTAPPSCTRVVVKTECSSDKSCKGTTTTTYTSGPSGVVSPSSCITSDMALGAADTTTSTGSGSNRTYTTTSYYVIPRVMQERICKYSGASPSFSSGNGPNMDCPAVSVLPLSTSQSAINATIDAMISDGATNIHEGAAWGYRTLTPSEPFAQARAFETGVSKVMIVMTDGENTAYKNTNASSVLNGSYHYAASGYPYNQALGTLGWSASQIATEMNTRTVQTCANAKEAGIVIYTIGLEPPDQTTINMLTNCASGTSYAKFPTASNQLQTVFKDIAEELSQLRLAR